MINIPINTTIYLTRKSNDNLLIFPGEIVDNQSMYVAYDVKNGGDTVIPKGTRVLGNWISEMYPIPAAQYQVNRIFLCNSGQHMKADSNTLESTELYNRNEVQNLPYFYQTNSYKNLSNTNRRVVNIRQRNKVLSDIEKDTVYLKIPTKEIVVTLLEPLTVSLYPSSH